MKTLKYLLFAALALSILTACLISNVENMEDNAENTDTTDTSDTTKTDVTIPPIIISPIIGQWKVIEENDAWDYDLMHPVTDYRVWEFFSNGTIKQYSNSNKIDEWFKTYELKSDSLYIYHDNIKEEWCTHIYRCQFIDAEKNKIKIEFLWGLTTDIKKPSLWIFERVNKE
ncbi:MAG: hypothetical protein LBB62_10045 [Proteiniphilum sp.]|nr:hypothetical protein [Proteiniphilum sp.]